MGLRVRLEARGGLGCESEGPHQTERLMSAYPFSGSNKKWGNVILLALEISASSFKVQSVRLDSAFGLGLRLGSGSTWLRLRLQVGGRNRHHYDRP